MTDWQKRLAEAELLLAAFEAERAEVLRGALADAGWILNRAACLLGRSPTTVYHWLRQHPELEMEYRRMCPSNRVRRMV
jgi:transcriptional regulator of acetoin/glycerol metabolism